MTQKYWSQKPTSFAETVELVERYVRGEIIKEVKDKQLYYHNLNHALGVKRRAKQIFLAIKPVLAENHSLPELNRLEALIGICGLAHDMVQIFEATPPNQSRQRKPGLSEKSSADKLLQYIQKLNRALVAEKLDCSVLISDREQQILQDGIVATICIPDPPENSQNHVFDHQSIYQPYLYDPQAKISIVGSIIALADLGALGIEGVEAYIQDGILVFLEDNPYLKDVVVDCSFSDNPQPDELRKKLLAMAGFIVDLAYERQARFELEIAGFETQIRQILRSQVFVHLNQASIKLVQNSIPHQSNASLAELVDFFCSRKTTSI